MPRIFVSHSSADWRHAVALKTWLVQQEPSLRDEVLLDFDPQTGIPTGVKWKDELLRQNSRCQAVVCLLSPNWDASTECRVEYRTAENLRKRIFPVCLEPGTGSGITREWQRCNLFGDGPRTAITVDGGPPVQLGTNGLERPASC